MKLTARNAAIHLGLFIAACVTTSMAGGPVFGATIMAILTCHEFGHYFVARWHRVETSLPYFIPVPFIGFGTLGAVIRMDKPITDRRALFDVGAAGPIAGLVVAIPLLAIGIYTSDFTIPAAGDNLEGNSILYALLKLAITGHWIPTRHLDIQMGPMANAAWVGLLVTMINLMPIGQLDGGHVTRAVFGDRHEAWSARLHKALPVFGLIVATVMFVAARSRGYDFIASLSYAKFGAIPWLTWTIMLAIIRGRSGEYHPAIEHDGDIPLDPLRKKLALGVLIVFLLIATPVPFRPVL